MHASFVYVPYYCALDSYQLICSGGLRCYAHHKIYN